MTHSPRFKPPTLLLSILVTMIAAHFVLPLASLITFPWNLVGAGLVVSGVTLNIIADQLFKGYGCITACRGPDVLVTHGPYALSRNPMYLGFAMILFGIAVLLGSVTPLLFAGCFVPLTNRLYIQREESNLAQSYADAWPDYVAKVKRWL